MPTDRLQPDCAGIMAAGSSKPNLLTLLLTVGGFEALSPKSAAVNQQLMNWLQRKGSNLQHRG